MYNDDVVDFCFKQKTAYEMRISDWSSDVCSSDLFDPGRFTAAGPGGLGPEMSPPSKMKQADPLRDPSRRKALAWTGAVAVASSLAVFGFSASAYGTVYETGRGEKIGRAHV